MLLRQTFTKEKVLVVADKEPESSNPNLEKTLDLEERIFQRRLFSGVNSLPSKFKDWVVDYTATNFPQLPLSQVRGIAGETIPFAFSASWGNYGAGFESCVYWRDGFVVHLQGLVNKTIGVPTAGDVVATLPLGYRPSSSVTFTIVSGGGGGLTVARIDVESDGDIVWQFGDSSGAGDYHSFSGLSFRALI